jgi:uncharacterized RDD family membrane protein YckC
MSSGGFEVICQSCRGEVASDAAACPHCGQSMFAPAPRVIATDSPAAEPAWATPARLSVDLGEPSRAYGGFWIRVLAWIIDSLLLVLPSYALQRTLGPAGGLLSYVIGWLYYAFMESSASQATVGKMACGLLVTDTYGKRISFSRATGRYFAKILSALTLSIGFAMVGWTRQKRGLHDFVAGTLVARG